MTVSLDDLKKWLNDPEDEHLEFKAATGGFDFDDLLKYAVALANEGGGRIVLGVTDKRPRKVVGTNAFTEPQRTKAGLTERLRLRAEADVLDHADGRVVVFTIPSRPLGLPLGYKGAFWMRSGDALVGMTPDRIKVIFAEVGPDYSAETCGKATLDDLSKPAIEKFRALWTRKSRNAALADLSDSQLLTDAELLIDGTPTYAALVLLGTRHALGRHLAQAEFILEYRSSEASVAFQQREEFREGFLGYMDSLWELVNRRNDLQHFHDGLFVADIRTFNEKAVRECLLNAAAHRDYRLGGSVFVRQFPRKLEVVSPGGLPAGITPQNIVSRQAPRNRRIADALARCGLVERSGQGADRMFTESIREGKPVPDFTGTDAHQVSVTLRGEVQDPRFLRFLETVGPGRVGTFTTSDFLVLDLIQREQVIPPDLKDRLPGLARDGVIESVGRGRGTRYILSRRFYRFLGQKGVYTRQVGLDRQTNKELLVKHLQDNTEGCRLGELHQVLPGLSVGQVQILLRELKGEGRVRVEGVTRSARWFSVPQARGREAEHPPAAKTQS